MNKRRTKIMISLMGFFLVGVLAFAPRIAWAHGETEIKVEPDTVSPGGVLTIKGEGFGQNARVTIVLEGTDAKLTLGAVETHGEDGQFTASLHVPDHASIGRYIIRASAKDKSAETSITLIEAGSKGADMKQKMEDLIPYRPWEQQAIFVGIALVMAGTAYVILRGRPKEASPRQVQ